MTDRMRSRGHIHIGSSGAILNSVDLIHIEAAKYKCKPEDIYVYTDSMKYYNLNELLKFWNEHHG